MVYPRWRTLPDHLVPLLLFWTYALVFPLNFGLVAARRGPFLNYHPLFSPYIRESGITSKPIFDLFLFLCFTFNRGKWFVILVDRGISRWSWLLQFSFPLNFTPVFVPFCHYFPVFPVYVQLLDLLMRVVVSCSWRFLTQKSSVLVKKPFRPLLYLFIFILLKQLTQLLHWFFKPICWYSWHWVPVLPHLQPVIDGKLRGSSCSLKCISF